MEIINKIKELADTSKRYVELRLAELKLEAVDKISSAVADIAASMVFTLFCLLCILFLSLSAAFLLSDLLGSRQGGFFVVAAFWFVTGFIIYAARHRIIKRPVSAWIISRIMGHREHGNEKP